MDEGKEDLRVDETPDNDAAAPARGRIFAPRNLLIFAGLLIGSALLLLIITGVLYRTGVFNSYIQGQFESKLSEIGIIFDAEVFRVTVSPLSLDLKNAAFKDKETGERLLFIRDARLGLTIKDLFAWQLSRDISIDSTEINGAEVWVKFDDQGRSNFSNLKLVEDEEGSPINFRYESIKFSLKDSTIHYGDLSRKLSADAKNIIFNLEPENPDLPDDQKKYKFYLNSTDSQFVYDGKEIQPVDIRATGVVGRLDADITELRLTTPLGSTVINGKLSDWAALKYDLNIESTVNLTQASDLFALGSPIRGIGNFKGKVSGQGENYRIDGGIDTESLTAEGIYLKAANVTATVEGTNSNYEANGTAIAELLTFEDFRIEFPKIAGNVRGTGSDFRWVGELQAVAARSKSLSLGGLFLSDAVAEYKDNQLIASSVNGRASKFSVGDTEFASLAVRNLRLAARNGALDLKAESAASDSFATIDYRINNIKGGNVSVKNKDGRTDIDVKGLRADTAEVKNTRLKDLTADEFKFTDHPNSIELSAKNLKADELNADGTKIRGLYAPDISVTDTQAETKIHSDTLRVASIVTGGAVLGSLNIAGVRLTIRQGRVEATSKDIDAGTITLPSGDNVASGGAVNDVKIARPVFILEPSGRYRATADMSLGGGTVGSIPLGAAKASVTIENNIVKLADLTAEVMDGNLNGEASIALNERTRSVINADFTELDLGKIIAIQSGRVIPVKGKTTGNLDLSFDGTDYTTTSGSVKAQIRANAGNEERGHVPLNGSIDLSAVNGLFNIDQANLRSDSSELTATGRFDLRSDDTDLKVALRSSDAEEVDRLVRVTGISPELEARMDSMKIGVAGRMSFDADITGNLLDPVVEGTAAIDTVSMRGRTLGSIRSGISIAPTIIEFKDGSLTESGGGNIAFNIQIPTFGTNNISVKATLSDVNAGNLLAALPVDLPEGIKDIDGKTSGIVDIVGLPDKSQGQIDITSKAGTVSGQAFDNLNAKIIFADTSVQIENVEIASNGGTLSAKGTYDMASTAFDLNVDAKKLPLPLALSFLPENSGIPVISGSTDLSAKMTGSTDRPSSISVNFDGSANNVVVNENVVGNVIFKGVTENGLLKADLTASFEGRPQSVTASVNFAHERVPFHVRTGFDDSPLAPFFALIPQLQGIAVGGNATGSIEFGGDLAYTDESGEMAYTTDGLAGTVNFSHLGLQLGDTTLDSIGPVKVLFNTREVVFESVSMSGGGSNISINGKKALSETAVNDLNVNGRLNLGLLNVIPQLYSGDNFFGGLADISIRIAGENSAARLSGTANIQNGSFATFMGTNRLSFDRLQAKVIFSSNQVQIDQATGFLGGGRFVASGGALIGDNLRPTSFRLDLDGSNITVPLPENFITTGDARLEVSGRSIGNNFSTRIAGNILARRSIYTKDIDLANIVGARREGSLSSGPSSLRAPQFDLTIEGNDALIIRNNIADLVASASLRLTGTTENPQISGRITANSGTVFFRKDRYIVQRGVLDFPPNTEIEPIINLQAESEIGGYQIFVNLSGPLVDTAQLSATVRSSPALPQSDVISLITTGSLSNTASGIPTLAQTGINTAAEVLTDSIINNPARKATDKLFGLNVFEIDPIISGERLNPSARLTVGRQINNNLRVTYSTNLSQDQNQVLAFEYRVSNKLSFIAQYEQRSLSNVTQDRNNFSFEVRFRKRF